MNIWEFRKLWFSCFKNTAMNRLAASLKVEYEGDKVMSGQSIVVYDKNTRVAYMDFILDERYKMIFVDLVFVSEKYSSQNLALKMFKEFYKNYKAHWWGYKIQAEFANNELSQFFSDAVKKGWFPEGTDETRSMNLNEDEFKQFKKQINDEADEKMNLLGDIPEPIMKDEGRRKDLLIGRGTVYKNLTKQQVDNLEKYYGDQHSKGPDVIMFDGGNDSYFGFFDNKNPNKDVLSQLSIKLAFYMYDKQIVSTDLNLVMQYMNVMQQFGPEITSGGSIDLYPNGLYSGSKEEIKFNSPEEIPQLVQNNQTNANKSRLRRLNGGK